MIYLIILIISALIGFSIRDYKDMHGKIVKMDLWGNIFITVSLFAFFSAVAFTYNAVENLGAKNRAESKLDKNIIKVRHTDTFELRQITSKTDKKESVSGYYFLIGGSFSGEKTENNVIKVFAKVDGYYRVVSFPLEKLRVSIDNALLKPTLKLEYTDTPKTNEDVVNSSGNVYIINCPEKYLPEKLIPIEL